LCGVKCGVSLCVLSYDKVSLPEYVFKIVLESLGPRKEELEGISDERCEK
jgi:hypothetical protein